MAAKRNQREPTSASEDRVYLLCRWWPYYSSTFPFERVDDLADAELPAALELLRQEAAIQCRARIESKRELPKVSPARDAMISGHMSLPRRVATKAETIDERPPSLVEAFGPMGWIEHRNHRLNISGGWGAQFAPTPTTVFHVTTAGHARRVLEALKSRCVPPEGQYRFRVEERRSLQDAQWIQFERALGLLLASQTPMVRGGSLVATVGVHWGTTPEGVPVWAMFLRDEAQAIERILATAEPEDGPSKGMHPPARSIQKPKGRGGRPAQSDFDADRRLCEAWETGQYLTFEQLGDEKHITKLAVEQAIDRHRKRVLRSAQTAGQTPPDKPAS